jgi:pyruvate dehydrogenase E2 component (dihydrolipoamide acetyltransferase)
MAVEVKLEELAPNLEGGTVLDVKVHEGDMVAEGQTIIELEAEKANLSAPSPVSGRVSKIAVKKNDQIKVGQTLCFVEGAAVEKNGESTSAVPIEKHHASPSVSEEAPVAANRIAEKQSAPVSAAPARAERPPTPVNVPGPSSGNPVIPAGPASRQLAREWGIDLRQVPGTGRNGRITREDVKNFVKELASGSAPVAGSAIQAPSLPDFEKYGPIERQALSGIRKATAKQMALAWSLIPHVTQNDVADITDLEAFRKQQEGKGPKLTMTAFALKAVAILLKRFPQFNSSLDLAGSQLILKQYVHIGVAVDTEQGLLVPVLRDVDKKSIQELASELTAVAERARNRQIGLEEMKGGTFTITNLGGFGGTGFTPIVNYPEVAILGMSRARLQPVIKDGAVVPRLILPLSLSYDHRVIDGADAARFTRRLAEMLEKPLVMLLNA